MAKQTNRLGRGLNSLISSSLLREPPESQPSLGTEKEDSASPLSPNPESRPPPTDRPPAETHRIDITDEDNEPRRESTISRITRLDHHERSRKSDAILDRVDSDLGQSLLEIDVQLIQPNAHQPRKGFDPVSIGRLARSIAESGILQPLLVRPLPCTDPQSRAPKRFELVAGERRLRAAKAAGVQTVPVIVKSIAEQESMELALVENIQREDLNPIDRARGYAALCKEANFNAEQVARRLGEDRSTVANHLRLLELPTEVSNMVQERRLNMGHARALLGASDAETLIHLAKQAILKGLSVRAVEALVKKRKSSTADSPTSVATQTDQRAHVADLEEKLQSIVKTKVSIQFSRGGKRGRIVIEYYSLDDFDRIAALLGYSEKDAG